MDNPGARAGADYAALRAPRSGVGDSVAALAAAAKQTFADLFELMALELKRAGATLASMVAWGALAVLMALTAWFGIMVAIVLGLVALDVHEVAAVLIVVALNIVGAGAIGYWCVKASKDLGMEATRRQLRITAAEASQLNAS
jgi:uncharacterized membrane protein YqjE